MSEEEFWGLIQKLNWDETGDDDAVIEPVVDALSEKSIEDILSFEEILAQKLYELDTLAHAKEIGEDAYVDDEEYFSVDNFPYARCVVVANGEKLYNRVLNNPQDFPKDMEFEAILGVASWAYEQKTDKDWDYVAKLNYETFSNKDGWA